MLVMRSNTLLNKNSLGSKKKVLKDKSDESKSDFKVGKVKDVSNTKARRRLSDISLGNNLVEGPSFNLKLNWNIDN